MCRLERLSRAGRRCLHVLEGLLKRTIRDVLAVWIDDHVDCHMGSFDGVGVSPLGRSPALAGRHSDNTVSSDRSRDIA